MSEPSGGSGASQAGRGMDAEAIARMFTGADGQFRLARWGRPQAPVVFGTDDATLATFAAALGRVAALTGRPLADTDPQTGANLMIFFLRDWTEMEAIPDLDRLLGDGAPDAARLTRAGARRYRRFRFDAGGAIRAAVSLVLLAEALDGPAAEALALDEAVRLSLTWSPAAFATGGSVAMTGGGVVPLPAIAALIRAAYDSALPDAATDRSLALRLAARVGGGP